MKAAIRRTYGPPETLALEDIARPEPADDEVLVKVVAAAVNPADWHLLTGTPFPVRLMTGLLKPKNPVLGFDLAGRVEQVGSNVRRFRPGDEVFGSARGAFAEYVCASETRLAYKPANVSSAEAAAVPMAAVTALQGLRDHGRIEAGQKVLIYGASGGVGTFAVQLAKAFDTDVTAVCSTRNLALVRSLGADHTVDYTQEDFARAGRRYELIFDTVAKRSFRDSRAALTASGVYVSTSGSPMGMLLGKLTSLLGGQRLSPLLATMTQDDLERLQALLEEGKIRPVIDRSCALTEVPAAVRYVRQGHAQGKVIINVQ